MDPSCEANHVGLAECYKNMGHLGSGDWHCRRFIVCCFVESMLTHISGLEPPLYASLTLHGVEASWRLGRWTSLEKFIDQTDLATTNKCENGTNPNNDSSFQSISNLGSQFVAHFYFLETSDFFPTTTVSKPSLKTNSDLEFGLLLLAYRRSHPHEFNQHLDRCRDLIGANFSNHTIDSYRSSYESVLQLHRLYEVEKAWQLKHLSSSLISSTESPSANKDALVIELLQDWNWRYKFLLPSFKTLESILNCRRVLLENLRWPDAALDKMPTSLSSSSKSPSFSLNCRMKMNFSNECASAGAESSVIISASIGKNWLSSARAARKANLMVTAHSAILQAQHYAPVGVQMESAKLLVMEGKLNRALDYLRSMTPASSTAPSNPPLSTTTAGNRSSASIDSIKLSSSATEADLISAKMQLLVARWLQSSGMSQSKCVEEKYREITQMQPKYAKSLKLKRWLGGKSRGFIWDNFGTVDWKSWGTFANKPTISLRQLQPPLSMKRRKNCGARGGVGVRRDGVNFVSFMRYSECIASVVKSYSRSCQLGSNFIYQTLPRCLTLWLDYSHSAPLDPDKKLWYVGCCGFSLD